MRQALKVLGRIVRHRTFIALVVVGIAWGGFASYEWFAAPGRVSPALLEQMQEQPYVGRIAVNLDFTPEDYHINKLQQYGIVAGVQGRQIYLVQVPTVELWKMAELYWIHSIQLAP